MTGTVEEIFGFNAFLIAMSLFAVLVFNKLNKNRSI